MKLTTIISIVCFVAICFPLFPQLNVELYDLKTEYQTRPIGIDITKPRFSWKLKTNSSRRGLNQEAYQLLVRDQNNEVIWDSGRIRSNQSHAIQYQGKALLPQEQYSWSVVVWLNNGEKITTSSVFQTGFLDPNESAWNGAQWIGGSDEDLILYAHAMSVFKLNFTVQLDVSSASTKAAFLYGGNDRRLQNANLNLMGVEFDQDESYIALEYDITPLAKNGKARLNIIRKGYTQKKGKSPLYEIDIPLEMINETNKYQPHTFYIEQVFGLLIIYVDGLDLANRLNQEPAQPSFFNPVERYNVNPAGYGNDYISFPMLADIGFKVNPNQQAVFSDIQIRNYRSPSNVLFNGFEQESTIFNKHSDCITFTGDGYQLTGGATGCILLTDPSKGAAPMLRTTFDSDIKIKSAVLNVSSRGVYEMYLNGKRISLDYFNPGVTQYYKHQMYQTYDVTEFIQSGKNAWSAWLGEGWWSGNITYSGENWNYFGDRQSLLAILTITYEDGSTQEIKTSPHSWRIYNDGPILNASFFQGEVYDARREDYIEGWHMPGFDDSDWEIATEVKVSGTTASEHDYENYQLVGQIGENVRVVDTLTARSVTEVRPGVFVYDMGQNMVGFPSIPFSTTRPGDTITFRYAEVLYPKMNVYGQKTGMIMMENIRAALTHDIWIANGEPDVFQPRFTFHGYRYVEITGIDEPVPVEQVKGLVLSSIHEIKSSFQSSNQLVNRLWQNIVWSMRGNFLSIPTDTPARNERMGWSGDLNVFVEMATYLGDIGSFLTRHMISMRDLQHPNGRFPDVAPVTGGFGGTLWGSAGVKVPWEAYRQYGDTSILNDNYAAMKAYVDFLETRIDTVTGRLEEGPLGDWLSPENNKNDNTLLWTAYQIKCLEIVSATATILGKSSDALFYDQRRQQRKEFFNNKYLDPETKKTIHSGHLGFRFGPPLPPDQQPQSGELVDTQASYAIPLAFDAFSTENKAEAIKHLVNTVKRENSGDDGVIRPEYSLMTGFIGTASLNHALSENGQHSEAYRLLQQTTYPSWLYPVVNGATTIWERLNSYTIENGFGGNNSMNSFNHYAFGAVGAWLYNYVLGIQRETPGFKTFVLMPTPDPTGEMTFAKGSYDSPYGLIVSEWKINENKLTYQASIPANTTATLYLPAVSVKSVLEGGEKLSKSKGIEVLSYENGKAVIRLSSGSYSFNSVFN